MSGEIAPDLPPIISACEGKFSETLALWAEDEEDVISVRTNEATGTTVERVCLDAERSWGEPNGTWIVLIRSDIQNETFPLDVDEEKLVFAAAIFPKIEGEVRLSEVGPRDSRNGDFLMVFANGETVVEGSGYLPTEIGHLLAIDIQNAKVIKTPEWLLAS